MDNPLSRTPKKIGIAAAVLFLSALTSRAAAATDFSPVHAALERAVAEGKVAGGSVLVLHRGEVVLGKGFGYADVKSKTPFRLETPVVIASISKPLLGTAAFRLAERKKLNLSVPITDYLPEFKGRKLESGDLLKRAPTTIELFAHISGMRYDKAPKGRPWFASWTAKKSLADVVKRFAAEFPFKAQPGTRYAYSGIGTDVAARILEVASGEPRNAMFLSEVAEPLGMKHSHFRDAYALKQVGPMPTRYYHDEQGKLRERRRRPVPPKDTYSSSGGSIISTAPDLARWLLMIRNKGIHEGETYLARETIVDLLTPVPNSSNTRGGLFVRERNDAGKVIVVGHTGSSGTSCWIDFERDLIGILFTQTQSKQIKPFRLDLRKRIKECFED